MLIEHSGLLSVNIFENSRVTTVSTSALTDAWSAPSRKRTSTKSTGLINSEAEGASGSLKAL